MARDSQCAGDAAGEAGKHIRAAGTTYSAPSIFVRPADPVGQAGIVAEGASNTLQYALGHARQPSASLPGPQARHHLLRLIAAVRRMTDHNDPPATRSARRSRRERRHTPFRRPCARWPTCAPRTGCSAAQARRKLEITSRAYSICFCMEAHRRRQTLPCVTARLNGLPPSLVLATEAIHPTLDPAPNQNPGMGTVPERL